MDRARFHLPGRLRRSEMPPADLARGMERDRERLAGALLIDASAWRIARTLQWVTRGSEGEGLRGIYEPAVGAHGQITWWPAHVMAHAQAGRLLGHHGGHGNGDVLEVEANVADDGTVFLAWNAYPGGDTTDHSERFLAHPSLGELVDGCLALRGRRIVLTPDGIRLPVAPVDGLAATRIRRERRTAGWKAIEESLAAWTRCRRAVDADGGVVPHVDALRPTRLFVEDMAGRYCLPPVPEMSVTDDRAIVLRWRGGGSATTLTFRDRTITVRFNRRGRVEEIGPFAADTMPRIRRGMPCLDLDRFRSHAPAPGQPDRGGISRMVSMD